MSENKLMHIKALQQKNKTVTMVNYGINDAPALVQADVGFAIDNGTDITIESADITLMHSLLIVIPIYFHTHKLTRPEKRIPHKSFSFS